MNTRDFAIAFVGKLDPAEEIRKSFETPDMQALEERVFKEQNAIQEPVRPQTK